MIFMHNKTGHILELMILSVDEIIEKCSTTGRRIFRVGKIHSTFRRCD
jgi:hypothetical protein